MSEREVGHAHLTGPTSWCWSAEIFVFHLFCVFSWQPHSHWPLSRHTILFHQIDDDEKRKNTLNFTLRFPEFLQFGKVFVQDEDFGQADGRHFSPLSPPSPGPVFQPTCNTWRNHSTLLSAVLFTVSLGWMSNLPGQKKTVVCGNHGARWPYPKAARAAMARARGSELGWERNATGGFSSSSPPLSFPTCASHYLSFVLSSSHSLFLKESRTCCEKKKTCPWGKTVVAFREKLVFFFFFDFALLYFPFWIREKLIGLLHCPAVRPRGIRNKRREETASDFDLVPTTLWSPRDDFFSPLFVMSCGR